MNLIIRPVARTDYDQWLPLWNGYNTFYGRSGPAALPEEITQTTWDRFFDDAEPVFALVAEIDGKLAGLTHYLFHRLRSNRFVTCRICLQIRLCVAMVLGGH
jgi:hypothetical protein